MLMTAPTALLSSIDEQARQLRAEILSATHEIPADKDVYYIAMDGDDTADGRSPEHAWKTLDALASHEIAPGSEVLFERGGLWRGRFTAAPGVTYSAFGDGDKPCIVGSPCNGAKVGKWKEVAPDIYRYSTKFVDDVGGLVMDGGSSHGLKKVINYSAEQPFDNVKKTPFTGYTDLEEDLEYWHDLGGANVSNPDGGYLYLCSKGGNPSERFEQIEFLTRGNVIRIGGNGVTIDNLCVMYGGSHGVGSGTTKDLVVTNCIFGWIGGALQFYRDGRPTRFGNGVEIYGGCDNYVIDHCWVYQIYDAGITHQLSGGGDQDCTMNHVRYTNNLIEYCTYSIEYFLGKSNREDAVRWMADIDMRDNILRFAGYGWGHQRPDKTQASHIKGWDSYNRLTGDCTIEDNILECSRYMMIHCGVADEAWTPVFRGNTFIQYAGGELGRLGLAPTKLMAYIYQNVIAEAFVGNEFYILPND